MSTSVLEMPIVSKRAVAPTSRLPESVEPDTLNMGFSAVEFDLLHRDDAMAGAMVATILGCAFSVLLVLTTLVGVWTLSVTT